MKGSNFHSKNYYQNVHNNFKLFLDLKLVLKLISSSKHLNYFIFEKYELGFKSKFNYIDLD